MRIKAYYQDKTIFFRSGLFYHFCAYFGTFRAFASSSSSFFFFASFGRLCLSLPRFLAPSLPPSCSGKDGEHICHQENRRPPLREAFFLVTLPPAYQREMLLGCPGMVAPWCRTMRNYRHLRAAESGVRAALNLTSWIQYVEQRSAFVSPTCANDCSSIWKLQEKNCVLRPRAGHNDCWTQPSRSGVEHLDRTGLRRMVIKGIIGVV